MTQTRRPGRTAARVPLEVPPAFRCFGCAPHNRHGLGLEFQRRGRMVVSEFVPEARFQGWFGTVHPGILAALVDELGLWTVAGLRQRIGVTRSLQVRLQRPLYVEEPILLEGEIAGETPQLFKVAARLLNARGDIGVEGEVSVFPLTRAQVAKMMPDGVVPTGLAPYLP